MKEYDGTLITEYAYDALGRRIEVTDHVSTADMCGDATSYDYNDLHQLETIDYANDPNASFTFDRSGRLLTATNDISAVTRTYDDIGRLDDETLTFEPGDPAELAFFSDYNYIVATNDIRQTLTYPDPFPNNAQIDGRTVTHTLDGRSRLSGVADNLGIGVTWDFDAGNRRELAHLSNGIESAFAYDLNNRLTRVTHADNVALLDPFHDVEHHYDPVGNLIWSQDHVSSDRSRLYAYDQRHRLVQFERGVLDTQTPAITTPSSDPVLPNSQSWLGSGGENLLDRRGNWTGFSSQINTSLAEQTRELDTTDKQNAGVNEYDHSMTRIGNQWVYEEFTYDDNGNLIAIDMVGDVNCDGVTDFNDNNVFILLLTDPQQYALDYPDCSGELGDVNNNGSVGFDDINGFVDLLTNLGDGEARRFDYDDENRLTAVKEYDGTLITEYAYDALGRRIEVTDHVSTADACGDATSPVRTRQVYSGLATIQEYMWCDSLGAAGEWTVAREFLYGASFLEPVALVDWSDLGEEEAGTEEVLHYVHDRLGSVVALTDAGDPDATPTPIPPQAVERYEYDPYGQTYIEVWDESLNGGLGGWATASESKYGNQLLWTAQRYDATVGLYHFPARAYSPRLGRWMQRDPLGYVDGVNLYQYVRSAATTLIDPMGLWWEPEDYDGWFPEDPGDGDDGGSPPPDPDGPDEPEPCPGGDDPEPDPGDSDDGDNSGSGEGDGNGDGGGDGAGGGPGNNGDDPGRLLDPIYPNPFDPDYAEILDYINQGRDVIRDLLGEGNPELVIYVDQPSRGSPSGSGTGTVRKTGSSGTWITGHVSWELRNEDTGYSSGVRGYWPGSVLQDDTTYVRYNTDVKGVFGLRPDQYLAARLYVDSTDPSNPATPEWSLLCDYHCGSYAGLMLEVAGQDSPTFNYPEAFGDWLVDEGHGHVIDR